MLKALGCLLFAVAVIVMILIGAGVKIFNGFNDRRDVEMVATVADGGKAKAYSAFGGISSEHTDNFTNEKRRTGSLAFNKNGLIQVEAEDGSSAVGCEIRFQGNTISASQGQGRAECRATVTPDGQVVPS